MTALLDRRAFQKWLLILAGTFAILWAVFRSATQSVTIDEAFSYLYFVAQPLKTVWEPNSNNHILNSLLMWMTTHAFGASSVTVRAPALLGAVLYVVICYFLCESIAKSFSLRFPLFVCLIYNPYVADYMVAARGYSLANAFLLTAICVPVWYRLKGRLPLWVACTLASLALGLSFAANFAFAFVDGIAFLAILAWAIQRRGPESFARIAAWCALPGLTVALLLCGYAIAHWHQDDLVAGTRSLDELRRSLVESSLYRLTPGFLSRRWYRILSNLGPALLPILGVFCVCRLGATLLDRSWFQDARSRELGTFAAALAGICAASLTVSWLTFRFYGLLLPLGRTGIYFLPLCTLLAGVVAAVPARSAVSQWLGRGLTAVFLCLAVYFVCCLRLSYFKEYEWDADIKDVYSAIARLNHSYGVTDVDAEALYITALNYYRVVSGRETFPKFELATPELSPGRSIYVINKVLKRDFIAEEKLAVVYRGKVTDIVVAVKANGPIPAAMILP